MLQALPVRTKVYRLGESFPDFLKQSLQGLLKDGDILAVTSKIVSIAEGRILKKSAVSKKKLIEKEADQYLGEIGCGCHLTIKENLLIPSAGVDESNAEGDFYILYPKNPFQSAKNIHHWIRGALDVKEAGVLLTDSRTFPLRRGAVGAALAYYGFAGVENQMGKKDLFGRRLKVTQINIADALAAAAVYTMGEGAESRPLAIIKAPVVFKQSKDNGELKIPLEEDLYRPLIEEKLRKTES